MFHAWRRTITATPSFLGEMRGAVREATFSNVEVLVDADADEVSLSLKASTGRLLLAARPVGIHVATAEGDGGGPRIQQNLS